MTMPTYTMFLDIHRLQAGAEFLPEAPCGALWVRQGAVFVDGAIVPTGEGSVAADGQAVETATGAEIWHFGVVAGDRPESPGNRRLTGSFEFAAPHAILRLDQVTFPSQAVAWRHVHPGAGIRCLVEGGLEIRSDHDTQMMAPGQAWFEAADSPVQATAIEGTTSSFVRAMVLPEGFAGQPTLRFLDPADAEKPRLQENSRFVDHRVTLRTP